MSLDKNALIDFLSELEKGLTRRITVIAVGGTAMSLLNLKASTIDIDLVLTGQDYDEFRRVLNSTPHGFQVHIWKDGTVFSQTLPEDYIEKSIAIESNIKGIELRCLHPLDIVVTKIGRLDERDVEDIEICVKEFHLTKEQIVSRAANVEYVGRRENYEMNVQWLIKRLF